jgi:hypothetical protein
MQSSLIGKIEKAKRYSREPERITFQHLAVDFKGDNNSYKVTCENSKWSCNCNFFSQTGTCSHIMALQRILEDMLPEEALNTQHGSIPV